MMYFRMAWRELRSSPAKFLFVVLAVAVGVGSLTGVRSFSRAFRSMLLTNARTLMAADMTLRIFALPTPEQQKVLADLEARGVRHTEITETVTMAVSDAVPQPLLVSLKAVDPVVYPFYGAVKLDPPASLASTLDARTAAVSADLLMRLKLRTGDTIRLGGQPFRIAGVLVAEPDRMTGTLNIGPRVMVARAGLDRTGLIGLGSRASQRWLFRLPPRGPEATEVRAILKKAFPESTIADYRETHPMITHGLDRSTTFLSLVSLIALIVGALGVGTAIDAHMRQKMDSIAILKCVGARSGQVLRIYVTQTLLLGLAGGLLGVAFGNLVERAFPLLVARFVPLRPPMGLDLVPALQGLAIGVAATLLFTLPPLLRIRGVPPSLIFRREMAEAKRRRTWREARASLLALGAILAGMGAIAAWLAEGGAHEGWRLGVYFVVALAVALVSLAAAARGLLAGLRRVTARLTLPPTLRHGLANLYRPGSQATAVLVSLGIGVMFTLTVYLLQHSLLAQIVESAPPGMPNVFLLDVPAADRAALAALATAQRGVTRPPEIMAAVAVRLSAIGGVPVASLTPRGIDRHFLRTRTVTWLAEKPPDLRVLNGAWWDPAHPPAQAQVCVEEEAARSLRVRPGSELAWSAWGRTIRARVACIERSEGVRLAARFEFIFSPGALDGLPAVYYGGMHVNPRDVPALQQVLYERFPTVTVVNVADVLVIVQQVVDQIALVYRFIALFTILAGAIILAASVAGTRFRRIRETAVLKTLGATRRRVAAIFSIEFLVLGTTAGAMGALLANGFTAAVLKGLLDVRFRFDILPALAATALTALLAVGAGWAASYRILGQKPLEVLRDE